MEGPVCPVTAAIAATGVTAAAWAASRSQEKPGAAQFATISALIFAGQMMNFPISHGTSGHLLGGALASALLGTPFGILAISLVLAVQCLLFSDGGIFVLGTNILNMALVGAGIGGWLVNVFRNSKPAWKSQAGMAYAAWLSVVLASLACSIELAAAGVISFATITPPMLATHALIGIGEALITVTILAIVPSCRGPSSPQRSIVIPLAASLLIALVFSPFASSHPDGLEWLAQKYSFFHETAPSFVAPLSDYAMPGIAHEALATGMAGASGIIVVFSTACLLSLIWRRSPLQ